MKKRIGPNIGDNSRIYLYEGGGGGGFIWRIEIWYNPSCSGYMVSCQLPGNDCNHFMGPTCIHW